MQDRESDIHQVKKRGGGILVYVKLTLAPYITECLPTNIVTGDIETMWLLLDSPKQKKILIGIVYRSPDGRAIPTIDYLDNSLLSFDTIAITSEILVIGDFNIDYKKSTLPDCKYLKEFERNRHLKQYIKNPTRITYKIRSTIDLIFSNMNYIAEVGVLKKQISDHQPIFIRRKKTIERSNLSQSPGVDR